MRIVVTGGSGFIGSALVKRLRQEHDVWNFDLRVTPGDERAAECDVTVSGSFYQAVHAIGPIDAVYHLAGPVVEMTRKRVAEACHAQLDGTLQVLETCRHLAIPKLLLASSFYVYAGLPPDAVANEMTPLDLESMEIFGAVKLMSERMVRTYAKSYGIDFVIFRFGSVYGYNQQAAGSNVIRTFLEQGFRKEPIVIWGPGARRNQYTLLDDVVNGCVAGLAAKNNVFNLVSPFETTTGELAALLRERYGFEIVFDESKPEGPSMAFMSSRKAVRELGWCPITIEDGIVETVQAAGFTR